MGTDPGRGFVLYGPREARRIVQVVPHGYISHVLSTSTLSKPGQEVRVWFAGKSRVERFEFQSQRCRSDQRLKLYPPAAHLGLVDRGWLDFRAWHYWDAVVRSSMTMSADFLDTLSWSAGTFFRVQALTTNHNDGTLRLKDATRASIRDQSRTSSAGEVGQAFAWMFARRHLGLRQVLDFDEALHTMGLPAYPSGREAPDFAASSDGFRTVVLVEAKGHLRAQHDSQTWKGDLKKALSQCDSGADFLASNGVGVHQAWGASADLRRPDDPLPSSLAYADPEYGQQSGMGPVVRLGIIRRSYANWALCNRCPRLALWLDTGDRTMGSVDGATFDYGGRTYFFPFEEEPRGPRTRLPSGRFPHLGGISGMGAPIIRGIDIQSLKALMSDPRSMLDDDHYPEPVDEDFFSVESDGTCLLNARMVRLERRSLAG